MSAFHDKPLKKNSSTILITCIALTLVIFSGFGPFSVHAQGYPTKPIRLVVAFAAGGGVDNTARIISRPLAEALNTTVVVENKAGASGTIGTSHVARASPDGYTLTFGVAAAMVIAPQMMATKPYNTLTDFSPVNLLGYSPLIIAVNPKSGISNFKDFIERSKTEKYSFGSAGVGSGTHLVIEMLNKVANNNLLHVPYTGGGPAVVDALAGHIAGVVADLPPLLPLFKTKQLMPLAITSDKRISFLPGTPTVSEEIPGFEVRSWFGIFAPKGTPSEIVSKLNNALIKVSQRADIQMQLKNSGVILETTESPEAFTQYVAGEYTRWGNLIKERGLLDAK